MNWDAPEIEALITSALAEDVGSGDLAAAATFSPNARATARIVALQNLVCAGLPLVEKIFGRLDLEFSVERCVAEGGSLACDAVLATLHGRASAMLTGESTVLNMLSHLCGIATLTREYVKQTAGTQATVRDSRSTTPALRFLEQYAIRMGGGAHHRAGLFDAMVLMRPHIAAAGGMQPALDQAHSHLSRLMTPRALTAYEAEGTIPCDPASASLPVQVEVCSESQLREALSAGAESILLIDLAARQVGELVRAVRAARSHCVMECSGDISLADARAYAEAGVDFLSPLALSAGTPWARLRLLVDGSKGK